MMARCVDALLVCFLTLLISALSPVFQVNGAVLFLLYNGVVIVLSGQTLGRYLFSLEIRTDSVGVQRKIQLCLRELFFIILFPILIINCLFFSRIPIHDRLCATKVIQHEY
jgi:hypothetical protein